MTDIPEPRVHKLKALPRRVVGSVRQLPRRAPTTSRLLTMALFTLVAIAITFLLPSSANSQVTGGAALAIVVLGLSFLTGWSGQISIGNSGFMMVGAYTAAIWANHHSSTPMVATLAMCTVAGALSGLILGLPATRLKGPYLAGMTLAFAYTLPLIVPGFPNWTGGSGGLTMNTIVAPQWFVNFFSGTYAALNANAQWLADFALIVAGVAFFFMSNLFHSRTGRAMRLVRDNDVAAELVGVHLPRTRTLAFVVSAAYGGLGGGILAFVNQGAQPQSYNPTLSIVILTIMVLGGIGTLSGAVIAGMIYAFSNTFITKLETLTGVTQTSPIGVQMKAIIFGGLLILTMLLAPRGLAGLGPLTKGLIARRNAKSKATP